MIASLALTTLVIEVPFLAEMFGFIPEGSTEPALTAIEYCISIGLAFLVIPVVEIVKAIQRAAAKKK